MSTKQYASFISHVKAALREIVELNSSQHLLGLLMIAEEAAYRLPYRMLHIFRSLSARCIGCVHSMQSVLRNMLWNWKQEAQLSRHRETARRTESVEML